MMLAMLGSASLPPPQLQLLFSLHTQASGGEEKKKVPFSKTKSDVLSLSLSLASALRNTTTYFTLNVKPASQSVKKTNLAAWKSKSKHSEIANIPCFLRTSTAS